MWAYTFLAQQTISHPTPLYVGYIACTTHLLSPLLFRFTNNVFLTTNTLITTGIIHQATFSYYSGGFNSNVIIWFSILPMIGGIICGKKAIILWAFITTSVVAAFLILTKLNYPFPNLISENGFLTSQLFLSFGWIFLNSIIIWAYVLLIEKNKKVSELANQEKSQFLASMSHELRTPLNAIIGYSELATEELNHSTQKSTVTDIGRINKAGKHLLSLVDDILDLSKVESGKMELHFETIDIHKLCNEATNLVQPLIKKNNNNLSCSCEKIFVRTDKTKIKQILFNLLSNASKFTKNGEIHLNIKKDNFNKAIIITAKDTGIGMSELQQKKIFDKFSQAESSISGEYGGTGLGLAIVKQFCELLGGDIRVDSQLNQGTTFTIILPLRTD